MLTMRTAWDQPYRPLHGDHAAAFMIELQPGTASQKIPLAVHIYLDISDSMNDNKKLSESKKACLHVIEQLSDEDFLTFTAFNHGCRRLASETKMSANNKQEVRERIEKLEATGITLLDGALQNFLSNHQKRPNTAEFLFLVSDGKPTDRKGTTVADVAPHLEYAGKIGAKGVTLLAVALGDPKDYDAAFFNKMAERTGGAFRFSPQAESLQDCMSNDMRVLKTTAISDVILDIAFNQPTTKLLWFGRAFPDKQFFETAGPKYRYRVGHLPANQPQTFIAYIMSSAGFDTVPGRTIIGQVTATSEKTIIEPITKEIVLEYSNDLSHIDYIDKGVQRWRLELDETNQTQKALEARNTGDQKAFDRHINAARRTRNELHKEDTNDLNALGGRQQEGDEERLARIIAEARKSRRPGE